MQHEGIRAFYAKMREHRILLSFMGVFSQQVMVEYGRLLNEREEIDDNRKLILFGIFVELTENILRYSQERASGPGNEARGVGVVIVSETDATYCVSSGNQVPPARAEAVKAYCDELATLDAEALRQRYREQRRAPRQPDQRGAGLGLIEVARRGDHPLACDFSRLDAEHAFLSLSIQINKRPTV